MPTVSPAMPQIIEQIIELERPDLDNLSFGEEVRAVMARLKGAVTELIAGLPGKPRTATAFARSLGLSNTVGWQLFQIATEPHALRACPHVPGAAALRSLARRAAKAGVAEAVIGAVEQASEQFDALVETHAGNRTTFAAMVKGLVGEGEGTITVAQRRAAFQLNGCIWGIQARAALWTMIVAPSSGPDRFNAVSVWGHVDLRRLRADAPFVLTLRGMKGEEAVPIAPTAIEPCNDAGATALLREFSSQPMPGLRSHACEDGLVKTELLPGAVGNTAAFTYFASNATFGHVLRRPGQREIDFADSCMCRTPVETFIHDVLVHDAVVDVLGAQVATYGRLTSAGKFPTDSRSWKDSDRLPVGAAVMDLGLGVKNLHDPDIPRYPEMLGHVCERMGIDAARLRAFRCRSEYPILFSTQVIQLDVACRDQSPAPFQV